MDYPLDKERSLIKRSEAQILKIENFENHATRTPAPHNSCTAFHIDPMVNAVVSKGVKVGSAYFVCSRQAILLAVKVGLSASHASPCVVCSITS